MTALALTVLPDTAAVAVEVTGAPVGAVTLTRTDDNGANPVRLRVGQEPIAGAMTVVDWEGSLTGTLRYDLVDSADAVTTATTTLAGAVTAGPRIGGVQLPAERVIPRAVTGYDSRRESTSTVLDVVMRTDPVVILGPMRTRRGMLEVWCADYAEAAGFSAAVSRAQILMLRQTDHAGLDMYFVAVDVREATAEQTDAGTRWRTVVGYVEVRPPALPLLGGAGWTFEDVAADYTDFAALRLAFDDFGDLVIGP